MSKLSFIDKLGVLLDVTLSSTLHIVLIAIFIFLGIVLATTKQKNKNRNKLIYIVVTIFLLSIIIVTYHASLGNMFSYMMDNFFIVLYFPNIAIYFAAIIATNIIAWISIFSFKTSKRIKTLNVIIYIVIHYIMILLLNVINSNKLDIFTQSSIYENKEATALIELTSIVFIIWIIFLTVYKIILSYLRKDNKQNVKKIIIRKKVKKLPENYEPLISPLFVYRKNNNINKNLNEPIIDLNKFYEDKINEEEAKEETREEKLKKQFEKIFTLEDYKVMSKILQEQKEKELAEKINLRDKILEENKKTEESKRETTEDLIIKIRQKAEEEKKKRIEIEKKEQEENKRKEEVLKQKIIEEKINEEENKYQELLNLYRVR